MDIRHFRFSLVHHFAVGSSDSRDSAELLDYLIGQGSDIHASDHAGWRPINYAAWFGLTKTVELLLSRGASAVGEGGAHPFDSAMASIFHEGPSSCHDTAHVLLEAGADPLMGLPAIMEHAGTSWMLACLNTGQNQWADLLLARMQTAIQGSDDPLRAKISQRLDRDIQSLLMHDDSGDRLVWLQDRGVCSLSVAPPDHPAYRRLLENKARQQLADLAKNNTVTDDEPVHRRL